jgi:hypothetical protein
MRHCEKAIDVDPRVPLPTGMRDEFGNARCSAKGRDRAVYIATLFVEPDDDGEPRPAPKWLQGRNRTAAEGAPPVALVDGTGETLRFPPPVKLYALSSERPKPTRKEQKKHTHEMGRRKNFREIDTLLTLATKFQLDVDARFGVADEGALVAEYFASVSQSVEEYADGTTPTENATDRAAAGPCDRGLTLVNWKYSHIPRLARAFGCGTKQGCPRRWSVRDFDSMWLMTFRQAAPAGGATMHGQWTVTGKVVQEGFDKL